MFNNHFTGQSNYYEYDNTSFVGIYNDYSSDSGGGRIEKRAKKWNSFGFSQIVEEDKFWPQSLSEVGAIYTNIAGRVEVPEPSCGAIMFDYLEKERVFSELK